jgi:hypothetical protein
MLIFGTRAHPFANPIDCLTKSAREILKRLTNKNHRNKPQPSKNVHTTQTAQPITEDHVNFVRVTPTKPQKDGTTKAQPYLKPQDQQGKPTQNTVDIISTGRNDCDISTDN